jgi:N-acetylglucosamine repressor
MADINRNLVVSILRTKPVVSRAEIVRVTGLSGATVSGIIAGLHERRLIEAVGSDPGGVGRPPNMVRLNKRANHVIGVKLTAECVSVVVTDLSGDVVYSDLSQLPGHDGKGTVDPTKRSYRHHGPGDVVDPMTVLGATAGAVTRAIDSSGVDATGVLGVCIGIAGLMDTVLGICRYSPAFGWSDVEVTGPLERHLGYPVLLENDVNALTVAERMFGQGHGVADFLVVAVGAGIGAGLVINGRLHRGSEGGAGEFGHTRLTTKGPLCSCGKRGCLEVWASDRAILADVEVRLAKGTSSELGPAARQAPLTVGTVIAAADRGDKVAQGALRRAGAYLGQGIASTINLLNPSLVMLSGEGLVPGQPRFEAMSEAVRAYAFAGLSAELRSIPEPLDMTRWARGCACVVLGELFASPIARKSNIQAI